MFRKLAIAAVLSVGVAAMLAPTPASAGILDDVRDKVMGKVGDVLFPGLGATLKAADDARKVGELSGALSQAFGGGAKPIRPLGKVHHHFGG